MSEYISSKKQKPKGYKDNIHSVVEFVGEAVDKEEHTN